MIVYITFTFSFNARYTFDMYCGAIIKRGESYDEDSETYSCIINLDEDEAQRFMAGDSGGCTYFRFYDEYKMVKKQN